MPARTLPLDYDLVIYSGASFRRDFRWRPEGGTPTDFTGWTGSMLLGPYHATAVKVLDTTNGLLSLSNTGILSITLDPAFTATLSPDGDPLAYQVDLTDPTGFVLRFLRGRVTVVRDVNSGP